MIYNDRVSRVSGAVIIPAAADIRLGFKRSGKTDLRAGRACAAGVTTEKICARKNSGWKVGCRITAYPLLCINVRHCKLRTTLYSIHPPCVYITVNIR